MVIDLKIGSFTHADAGQMHFYLNYARENWGREEENPSVGLILCSEKDEALAMHLMGCPIRSWLRSTVSPCLTRSSWWQSFRERER